MNVTLADIAKNGRERVRVSLGEFRGSRFADLRIYATNGAGEVVPTPKGIAVRRDMLPAIICALQEAERALAGGQSQ